MIVSPPEASTSSADRQPALLGGLRETFFLRSQKDLWSVQRSLGSALSRYGQLGFAKALVPMMFAPVVVRMRNLAQ
jgi:hypothetical protein